MDKTTVAIKSANQERRRTQRSPLIVQVECKTAAAYTLGRSADVSQGGLSILTSRTLALQSEVLVRFNLPPYPPGIHIESRGIVIHLQPGGMMGIRFLDLTELQRDAISKYVLESPDGSTTG